MITLTPDFWVYTNLHCCSFSPVCVLLVSKLKITLAQGYRAYSCRSVKNMMTRICGHVRTGNSKPIFLLALREKKGQSVQINTHYLALRVSHIKLVTRPWDLMSSSVKNRDQTHGLNNAGIKY